MRLLRLLLLMLCGAPWAPLFGAITAGLQSVPFDRLSDREVSPIGGMALAIRPGEWQHAETANFVFHYFQSSIANPVAVEAEFYYRVIVKELGRDAARWEQKCHIYIFETPQEWESFRTSAWLDPWTGGLHAGNELFIQRDPRFRWKGDTLAHEVTHLILDRFFGRGVPLWLNEGYAQYAAARAYASYHRARGFSAHPQSDAVAPERFLPLTALLGARTYPSAEEDVRTFYRQSERLTRYLCREGRPQFLGFLENIAAGDGFELALTRGFGGRFQSVTALEKEFRPYASRGSTED